MNGAAAVKHFKTAGREEEWEAAAAAGANSADVDNDGGGGSVANQQE